MFDQKEWKTWAPYIYFKCSCWHVARIHSHNYIISLFMFPAQAKIRLFSGLGRVDSNLMKNCAPNQTSFTLNALRIMLFTFAFYYISSVDNFTSWTELNTVVQLFFLLVQSSAVALVNSVSLMCPCTDQLLFIVSFVNVKYLLLYRPPITRLTMT